MPSCRRTQWEGTFEVLVTEGPTPKHGLEGQCGVLFSSSPAVG